MGHIKTLKQILLFTLLTLTSLGFAQTRQCECPTDSFITQYTTNCRTKYLQDSSMLYYQFNCDSIWLTLENKTQKHIIFSMTTEYYSYTYRLGYQFAKEFNNSILFRSGCPANGPCNFILVDKKTGKTITEFGELIYDHSADSPFVESFILYFSDSSLSSITIDYIDSGKIYKISVDGRQFKGIIPEYEIDNISVKDSILSFTQPYLDKKKWSTKTVTVDLKKYAP
jgi:hypothetical protein